VVTGEGSWDAQSSMGKVTGEVVARARAAGVPVLVVAGTIAAPLPEDVAGVSGADSGGRGVAGSATGEVLEAAGLARLAREGLAGLLARRRPP
jgi:glycerate kinase